MYYLGESHRAPTPCGGVSPQQYVPRLTIRDASKVPFMLFREQTRSYSLLLTRVGFRLLAISKESKLRCMSTLFVFPGNLLLNCKDDGVGLFTDHVPILELAQISPSYDFRPCPALPRIKRR